MCALSRESGHVPRSDLVMLLWKAEEAVGEVVERRDVHIRMWGCIERSKEASLARGVQLRRVQRGVVDQKLQFHLRSSLCRAGQVRQARW